MDQGAIAYSVHGKILGRFDPPGGAGAVYGTDLDGDGPNEVLTLGTTEVSGLKLSVFSAGGKMRWSVKVGEVGGFVKAPIFVFKLNGRRVIGVAGGRGVRFYSTTGKEVGRISLLITAAARLPGIGNTDHLLLRGNGFLGCYGVNEK